MSSAPIVVRPEDVARAFLTPRAPAQRVPLAMPNSKSFRIPTSEGEIAIQRAGEGPLVLLLHGWEGQSSDLAGFVEPLLRSRHTVVAMDLPAHGDSSGRETSIPQSARALRAVGEVLGPLRAVIAHSIGTAVAVEAMYAGMSIERAALIAAPAHYERYVRLFAAAAGLDDAGTELFLERLRETVGVDISEISLPRRAPHLHQRALFVHSADDRVISIEDSRSGASVWAGALHVPVDGLGHRRILADAAVIAAVVRLVINVE